MHAASVAADCKDFKFIGLKATFYNDEDMLKLLPLQSHKKVRSSSAPPVPGEHSDRGWGSRTVTFPGGIQRQRAIHI